MKGKGRTLSVSSRVAGDVLRDPKFDLWQTATGTTLEKFSRDKPVSRTKNDAGIWALGTSGHDAVLSRPVRRRHFRSTWPRRAGTGDRANEWSRVEQRAVSKSRGMLAWLLGASALLVACGPAALQAVEP